MTERLSDRDFVRLIAHYLLPITHYPFLSKLDKCRSRQKTIARVARLRKTNSHVFACVSKSCLESETETERAGRITLRLTALLISGNMPL